METNKNILKISFANWLPLAIITIILGGLVYVGIQQNYRSSAFDPQIQISEDIAAALSKGEATPDMVVSPTPTTEMYPSLSTFLVIYNATGTPMGSSVSVNGQLPNISLSALNTALKNGQNRITWQPDKNVKVAAVITPYKTSSESGFVLVARSIREVLNREKQLGIVTATATALALILSFLVILYFTRNKSQATQIFNITEAQINTTVKLD